LILSRSRAFLAAAVACATAGGCARTQGATSKTAPRQELAVRVAPVAVQDVVYQIKALGSLEAEALVQVTAEVEGAVSAVLFHEGDRVNRETVLLRIDPDRYRLQAEQAEATYRKALADHKRALQDRERRETLFKDQLVAIEEMNRANGETERLSAEAAASKAARDMALQNLRRAEVRPSQAGVINTRAVDPGQYVKYGATLATLVDTSRLRLRFKVSEAESLRAHNGGTVSFRVAAIGEHEFPAVIYHVGDLADPATRQVEVLAWVRNPGMLKPGFFAEVTLGVESKKDALVVPEGAIQASERGFITYAVEDGKARVRPVQIGLRTGTGIVEILSGLRAGEIVVTEGSDRLGDGVTVRAADTPSTPTPTPSAP
jgi:RND family efflux transporter MFP subunit